MLFPWDSVNENTYIKLVHVYGLDRFHDHNYCFCVASSTLDFNFKSIG